MRMRGSIDMARILPENTAVSEASPIGTLETWRSPASDVCQSTRSGQADFAGFFLPAPLQ